MRIADWQAAHSNSAEMHDLAFLNVVAYPRFYLGLNLGDERLLELSKRLLTVKGGELSRIRVAISEEGKIVGFASFLPEGEFERAVARTAFETIKFVDREERLNITAWMKQTGDELPGLGGEALYLSRIAVSDMVLGTGLGFRLLKDFEQHASGAPTSLHVDTSNSRAISFYSRNGYVEIARSGSVLVMRRPGDSGD